MRLNKKTQYGLLFVLYICRAGRVTIDTAAENLKLSKTFLEQVARDLRLKGLVRSIRGPLGGYELVGNPTVEQVLNALTPVSILSSKELTTYRKRSVEYRSLVQYVYNLNAALYPLLKRTIRNIGAETVANELALMNRAGTALSTTEN